jgi:hypothetical protein
MSNNHRMVTQAFLPLIRQAQGRIINSIRSINKAEQGWR